MQPVDLLFPVFVQVALTFVLLFSMIRARVRALRGGGVKTADIALGQQAWPTEPTKLANAFGNQLELPVLFYVVVAFAMITSRADIALVLLAWLFVLSRIWHAYVHVTHNIVAKRFTAYAAGVFILLAMWAYFALAIIASRFV